MELDMALIQALVIFLQLFAATNAINNTMNPSCKSKCGNVEIPYPFGIGEGCHMQEHGDFRVYCNESSSPPKPTIPSNPSLEITQIDLIQGLLYVNVPVSYQCASETGKTTTNIFNYDFIGLPYAISDLWNDFLVMGCDVLGVLRLEARDTGCLVSCNRTIVLPRKGCPGLDCCTASFRGTLTNVTVGISSLSNYSQFAGFSRCGAAFFSETNSGEYLGLDLYDNSTLATMDISVALEWAIRNETYALLALQGTLIFREAALVG